MDLEEKKALLNASLERAAEQLGDITPHVYARYYERCPDARASFEELHPGNRRQLEGQMVEQALYCLMEWYDCPGEIEIILVTTIPHHIETLHVKFEHFAELIDAVCETVTATIPPQQSGELAVWEELQAAMKALCKEGAEYVRIPARQMAGS